MTIPQLIHRIFLPSQNTHNEEVEEIYKRLKYNQILWVGGFVKTTLSSALIGGGVTFFLTGINNHILLGGSPIYQANIGIVAIILGVFIVYVIDLEKKYYKKTEIQEYNNILQEQAHKIATKLVEQELTKIGKENE